MTIASTVRKSNVLSTPVLTDLVVACGACDQEMVSVDGTLPLHMSLGRLCLGSLSEGQPPKFGPQIKEPLTIPDVAKLSISEIVAADTCMACGGLKPPGHVFCRTCYELLPFLHKKCIPQFMRGYLFADENKDVRGHYTIDQFKAVYREALEALMQIRSGARVGPPAIETHDDV